MYSTPKFLPAGDQALVVELGDEIDPEVNRRVRDLARAIDTRQVPGVVELVPTYRSLLVQYDAARTSPSELQDALSELVGLGRGEPEKAHVVHIPTLYGGEHGPDLPNVAERAGLTPDQVVELHSTPEYLVYMMGFTPGFPYLGGLDQRLSIPRLSSPRQDITAGSVGIAEGQTGIYPVTSPGGWRIIGRTPVRLFDPTREPPSLLSAGDYVLFMPLDGEEDYHRVQAQVETGEFHLNATIRSDSTRA